MHRLIKEAWVESRESKAESKGRPTGSTGSPAESAESSTQSRRRSGRRRRSSATSCSACAPSPPSPRRRQYADQRDDPVAPHYHRRLFCEPGEEPGGRDPRDRLDGALSSPSARIPQSARRTSRSRTRLAQAGPSLESAFTHPAPNRRGPRGCTAANVQANGSTWNRNGGRGAGPRASPRRPR